MKLKKAMLLFAAAAVAAGTVAGCSGSAKETTAASVAETNAEETKEETTAEETQKEKTAAEEEDEENYDTGDAALDNTRNQDEIGEKELLVVSFGTSYNDSRRLTIGAIEDAIEKAEPDFSVRRGFTSQIIIDHVKKRDDVTIDNVTEALDRAVNNGVKTLVVQPTHLMHGAEYDEKIDNMDQALERAVSNGVKNLIIQPTHLMHGAEYDELKEAVDGYKDKFESVTIAEPLLGEVGSDATVINEDKQAVAEAITAQAVKSANYDSLDAAAEDGTAFVFMGHGTSHTAKVTYSQMQTQMDTLGYKNVFIGTVEGEPEETACENVIEAVKAAGYKKVILRPLMVVAGDHANNDMAGEDEDSWKSQFEASGAFDEIDTQIEGLGRIDAVEQLYVQHTKAAMDGNGVQDDAE